MTLIKLILAVLRRFRTWLAVVGKSSYLSYGRDLHVGIGTTLWAPTHLALGDCVYIGKHVHIEANCRIGSYCLIANSVAIVGRHDHDFSAEGFPMRFAPWIGSKRFPSQYAKHEAVIQDDVWLGYGAIVLTGLTIGRGSVVAAGSVVTHNIPPYSIAAGIPAKVIGQRFNCQEAIGRHEAAIRDGKFNSSERGYDHFVIEPKFKEDKL